MTSGPMFNSAAWRRRVIGTDDLTWAQKVVLLALETFADYRDGSNAHPGIRVLAEMCGLTETAVGTALRRGRELDLIDQTAPANRAAGKAAVYQLILTPTAVEVTEILTPTAVEVTAPSYPNGDDPLTSTATTVLPQQPLRPPTHHQLSTKGGSPQPGTSPGAGGNDRPALENQSANSNSNALPPSPFCADHPQGTPKGCNACGDARRAREAWDQEQAARIDAERAVIRAEISACSNCDQNGFTEPDEGPTRRCTLHRQLADLPSFRRAS